MRATSQTEWEALLRKRSLILNRPGNDPKRAPRFFQCLDFSKRGLEQMLEERTGANGSLLFYRQQVKEALAAWATYNSRQAIKAPTALGVWAETIDKNRAYVRTIEAECRELNRLLDEIKAKGSKEQKARQKPLGIMKMRNGVLASVDGRAVVAAADGELVFEDDKTSVAKYLNDLNQVQREKARGRAAANRARHEHLVEFYGTEGKK